MAIEAPDDDAGDDMPEISIDADEKLRYWRGKLDQTPKLKKRDVFELAAGDIFAEAENEHDLRAYRRLLGQTCVARGARGRTGTR